MVVHGAFCEAFLFAPNALLSVGLLCRGQQEPRVHRGRRAQWDPKGIQGNLAQRVFEASQVLGSVQSEFCFVCVLSMLPVDWSLISVFWGGFS